MWVRHGSQAKCLLRTIKVTFSFPSPKIFAKLNVGEVLALGAAPTVALLPEEGE